VPLVLLGCLAPLVKFALPLVLSMSFVTTELREQERVSASRSGMLNALTVLPTGLEPTALESAQLLVWLTEFVVLESMEMDRVLVEILLVELNVTDAKLVLLAFLLAMCVLRDVLDRTVRVLVLLRVSTEELAILGSLELDNVLAADLNSLALSVRLVLH